MSINIKRAFCFVFSLAVIFGGILAVGTAKAETQTAQSFYQNIPEVYIDQMKLPKASYKAGEELTGFFIMQNVKNFDVPELYYTISLVGDYQSSKLANAVYDSQKSDPVYLKAKEAKLVDFRYKIPDAAKGDLGIQVGLSLKNGLPLGWADFQIKVSGGAGFVTAKDARLLVADKPYGLQVGPTVNTSSGEKAVFQTTLSNGTAKDITLTPFITLYSMALTGDNLGTTEEASTTIKTGASKKISINLPLFKNTPGVYVASVIFKDASGAARTPRFDVKYIIGGDIVNIQSVTSDKSLVNTGDAFNLKIIYSGSPADIADLSKQASVNKNTLSVKVYNELDQLVGENSQEIDFNSGSTALASLTARADSQALRAEVAVSKGGKVLKTFKTNLSANYDKVSLDAKALEAKTAEAQTNKYTTVALIAVAVILILAGLVFLLKRSKNGGGRSGGSGGIYTGGVGYKENVGPHSNINSKPIVDTVNINTSSATIDTLKTDARSSANASVTMNANANRNTQTNSAASRGAGLGTLILCLALLGSLFFAGAKKAEAFTLEPGDAGYFQKTGTLGWGTGLVVTVSSPGEGSTLNPGRTFFVQFSTTALACGNSPSQKIQYAVTYNGTTKTGSANNSITATDNSRFTNTNTFSAGPFTVSSTPSGSAPWTTNYSGPNNTAIYIDVINNVVLPSTGQYEKWAEVKGYQTFVLGTPPAVTISANPTEVAYGYPDVPGKSQISWSSTGATSCVGLNFNTSNLTSGSVYVSNLLGNTTYSVRCQNAQGWSDWISTTVTLPPPSTNLTYSCNAGTNQTILNWTLPAGYSKSYVNIINAATGAAIYSGNPSFPGSTFPILPSVFTTDPSITYSWWAQTSNLASPGAWSAPAYGNFRCSPPTVTLTATPSSIPAGGSSLLTWTSTNATTCTSPDFDTAGAPNNTIGVTVTPPATKIYHITCTGNQASANDQKTVTVGTALNATCAPNPTTAPAGNNVVWTAVAAGGAGNYGYSWSGTDGLTGTTASVNKTYATSGTKTASVIVTSPAGSNPITVNCSPSLNSTYYLNASLSASPSTVNTSQNSTLTASIASTNAPAGTPSYRFMCDSGGTWSAPQSGANYTCSYPSSGVKMPQVEITQSGVVGTAATNITVNSTTSGIDPTHSMSPTITPGTCSATINWSRFSQANVAYDVTRTAPVRTPICSIPSTDTTTNTCADNGATTGMINGNVYLYEVKATQGSLTSTESAQGTYTASQCGAVSGTCALPNGTTLLDGQQVTYYKFPSVPKSQSCSINSQTVKCVAGTLNYIYPTDPIWLSYPYSRCITGQEQ